MKQNDLIKKLLQNYRTYNKLDGYFSANPSYIQEPIDYISSRMKEEYNIDLDSMKKTSKVYECLSEASLDLYCVSLFTGFQTGLDLAMVLMGYEPVYNVLPDSQPEQDTEPDSLIDSRTEAIASNITELVKVAGADKVAQLVHSLGYGSVAEMIAETEKES